MVETLGILVPWRGSTPEMAELVLKATAPWAGAGREHRFNLILMEPVRDQNLSCEALYVPKGTEGSPAQWLYCISDLGHEDGHWAYRPPWDDYVPWDRS